ncbi:DUF5703 family protein [Saccharothrix coeruleofusca]|uniref:Dihydroorotate dehydrogenase n=1 Tax=Saccharothrix coeruleofusca TaxID=33919 RepID=A0A918ALH9_9PSEU|nr:DUF5703 family protein [Saccharothrix coeruleofusca]MBP2336437.1 hypothetical protein [Saccharothrix coeruleofusca]GGP53134.1 hypothetical protein GCM10010185_26570 [Saccharothrix coeruleofusca]
MNEGVVDGDWEYRPLRLPAGLSRRAVTTQLSIQAEFSGWELSRTLLFGDGSRKVWLRRKRTAAVMPGLIT